MAIGPKKAIWEIQDGCEGISYVQALNMGHMQELSVVRHWTSWDPRSVIIDIAADEIRMGVVC